MDKEQRQKLLQSLKTAISLAEGKDIVIEKQYFDELEDGDTIANLLIAIEITLQLLDNCPFEKES